MLPPFRENIPSWRRGLPEGGNVPFFFFFCVLSRIQDADKNGVRFYTTAKYNEPLTSIRVNCEVGSLVRLRDLHPMARGDDAPAGEGCP
jgi:hypothetical protein